MSTFPWRSIGYWVLVVCSAWALLAGMFFWVQVGGEALGIVQAQRFAVPPWHLAVPLFGLLSLLLLLARPPGTYWALMYLSLPMLAVAVLALMSLQGRVLITLPTSLVPPLCLCYVAIAILMAFSEAVPLNSPLVRLVYVGRVRHLHELYLLARLHGWGVKGPEQPEHAVTVSGKWQARRVMVQSGARYVGPADGNGYFLRVAVETRRRPWPMFLGVGTAQPRRSAALRARVRRCDTARGRPAIAYFWPPEGVDASEEQIESLQAALEAGCAFLRDRTVIRSLDNGILFFRWSGLRQTENAEQVERLIDWLARVAEAMEQPGFTEVQPPSAAAVE